MQNKSDFPSPEHSTSYVRNHASLPVFMLPFTICVHTAQLPNPESDHERMREQAYLVYTFLSPWYILSFPSCCSVMYVARAVVCHG